MTEKETENYLCQANEGTCKCVPLSLTEPTFLTNSFCSNSKPLKYIYMDSDSFAVYSLKTL